MSCTVTIMCRHLKCDILEKKIVDLNLINTRAVNVSDKVYLGVFSMLYTLDISV